MKHIVIHAPNIHGGGGKVLLQALLENTPTNASVLLNHDSRFSPPNTLSDSIQSHEVPATISQRLKVEIELPRQIKTHCKQIDTSPSKSISLCFGNLPPLRRLDNYTILFLQNRLLLDTSHLSYFSSRTKYRLKIERFWLKRFIRHVDHIVVQTPSMEKLVKEQLSNTPVTVCGFQPTFSKPKPMHKLYDFTYVASADPHKNHRRLIEAWTLLANNNHYPALALTLNDTSTKLGQWIKQQIAQHNLNIHLLGTTTFEETLDLYQQSHALVFPSLVESFGLPLIEAAQLGLPIIASDRDFVHDVVTPSRTFDPIDSSSIAESILNSQNNLTAATSKIHDKADALYQHLFDIVSN